MIMSYRPICRPCSRSSSLVNFPLISLLSLFLSRTSNSQREPVTNFCRRFGHQTAVIDRKLYIDGGFVNWNPLSTNPTNYTNTWLLYQDLDHLGTAGMPQLYANLSKNATLPSVNGGIFWADDVNKKIYLFGGEYHNEPPEDYIPYAYDVLEDTWEKVGDPPDDINSVSYGAGVSVSSIGAAFYYGGWLSNNSVPGWNAPRKAVDTLIRYSFDTQTWTNSSGPDNIGRAEGAMVYMPASDGGMLVYFGGLQDFGNGTVAGQSMKQIFIYDMLRARWYEQTATGEVPQMRTRFCAGITWAGDQSSYNIYIYGGAGLPPSTQGLDDVYVLSIPSFTWINFWPQSSDAHPRHSLSCDVIDGTQMIIIGGTFPLDNSSCDDAEQFGSQNLDLGNQNPQGVPWHLYQPNLTSYGVPDDISEVIGGGPLGGATKTVPDGGFGDEDLSVHLGRKFTPIERNPTRPISRATRSAGANLSKDLPKGAIGGIAAACTISILAILFGVIWFVRRRRLPKWYPSQNKPSFTNPWRCKSITCAASSNNNHHNETSTWEPNATTWSPSSSHNTPDSLYALSPSCVAPPHSGVQMIRSISHPPISHPRTRTQPYSYDSTLPGLQIHIPRHQPRQQSSGPIELGGSTTVGSLGEPSARMGMSEISPQSTVVNTGSTLHTAPSNMTHERSGRQPLLPPPKYEPHEHHDWTPNTSSGRRRASTVIGTCDTCQQANTAMTVIRNGVSLQLARNHMAERVPRRRFSFDSPESPEHRKQSWDGSWTPARETMESRRNYATAGFGPAELSADVTPSSPRDGVVHETFYHP
ncbi:hypothetical protein GGR57DRAFT_26729 [Xylariaceae sp. FL1272]|nr:hypothetical protein GGR57DRAFT_26729 [Xylariaceae sp. FL1272]